MNARPQLYATPAELLLVGLIPSYLEMDGSCVSPLDNRIGITFHTSIIILLGDEIIRHEIHVPTCVFMGEGAALSVFSPFIMVSGASAPTPERTSS